HANDIQHANAKKAVLSEYMKRVRKILKSKLNAGNTIQAINSWAIPVIRYTAGVIDWTRLELDELDRKTRKLMTAHHALHPQSDVDRLYLARNEGGRGLLQVRQSVEEEECALTHYVSDSAEPAMKEVNKEGLLKPSEQKPNTDRKFSMRERGNGEPRHYMVSISKTLKIKSTKPRHGNG